MAFWQVNTRFFKDPFSWYNLNVSLLHKKFGWIANYGKKGTGPVLQQGMTLAIEPMIVQWDYAIVKMGDGWTTKTKDGGISAHVEDTVLVMNDDCEVLTRP